MREALRSYRQMVYLDDLSDDEFVLLPTRWPVI